MKDKKMSNWLKMLYIFLLGIAIGALIFTLLLKFGIIQYCNFDNVISKSLCG